MAQPSFDSILNAVMQAESGGRRYDDRGNLLTSPKGAQGEMQVMPRTAKAPGFGVEPAKSSSPEELARVGRDYLRTMLDRYGSLDRALVAYNWGPKNADAWIAKGADPAKLPDETKKYVSRVQSTLSAQPRTTAQASATPEAAPAPTPARGAPAAAPTKVSEARPADLGPSYQAALALSFLSDEDEKESGLKEYDERQPSAAQQWLARETRKVTPESLAMPFSSPFAEPEPVKAADGGFIAVGYQKGGEARSDRMERIKRTAPGVATLNDWARTVAQDMYPREADAVKRDAARHMMAAAIMADKTNPGMAEALGKAYELKEAPFRTMGHWLGLSNPRPDYATDTFNNALGTRFANVARDPLELQRAVRASIERGEANLTPDEIRAPSAYAEGGDVSAGSEEDILARAQAAAREGQAYRDMQEYLKARDAMPDIRAGSLPSQTAAEFQRTILPVGAGTIKVNRGRLADRARETLPATLTHELAHAVDRQISQQAAEQAGMPNQFTEAYRKLVGPDESRRADTARKLDPSWEQRNRSYRSSPRELAGHGMGAFVDNTAQAPGPRHVDATAATELAILMDLAQRHADKKPKGLERIPAFLRGIGYAEGGEVDKATARGMLESLKSGEGAQAFLRGLTMLPQNIVGAPVDVITMAMRPFGYSVDKPVGGSDWLKEKSRQAGVAFAEPTDANARALYTAGDLASNLVNPAGATRAAVRGVKEVADQAGQAARMLRELKPPSGPDLAPAGVPAAATRNAPEKSLEELVGAPMKVEGSNRDFWRLEEAARAEVREGKPVTAIPKERMMQFTQPVMPVGKDLQWVRLTDPRATILEGGAMNHSIGEYSKNRKYGFSDGLPAFLRGEAEVYSLRNAQGQPLVTMEVQKYKNGERWIHQIKGPSNSDPSAYRRQIFEFMDNPNLKVIHASSDVYKADRTGKPLPEKVNIYWNSEFDDWKLGILDHARQTD